MSKKESNPPPPKGAKKPPPPPAPPAPIGDVKAVAQLRAEVEELKLSLAAINDIKNSIVGLSTVNTWTLRR